MSTVLIASSAKISLFVGAIFLSIGVYLPFFPLWLENQAFTTNQIAILLTVPLLVRVSVTPFLMTLAGRLPQRRQAALAYTGFALLAFASLSLFDGFWPTVLVLGLFGMVWHALVPLGDSFALSEVRLHGANYGTIRLWGSITFVLANFGAGAYLGVIGPHGAYGLIVAMLALAFLSACLLPSYGVPVVERPRPGLTLSAEVLSTLTHGRLMGVAVSAGLIQASHAMVYGFGTINWIARGYSTTAIGMFWAVGVIAEILLFTQARRLFGNVSSSLLVAIGGLAAILRWIIHGDVDGEVAILVVQCLHGLSFGATHLGMQGFIAREFGEHDTPTAQGGVVLVSGVTMAAATLLCGGLYDRFGIHAFYAMAAMAALAFVPLLLIAQPHRAGSGG